MNLIQIGKKKHLDKIIIYSQNNPFKFSKWIILQLYCFLSKNKMN